MSRILCASCWALIALALCSCAEQTVAPVATPAADSRPATPDGIGEQEQPTPPNVDRPMDDSPMVGNRQIPDRQPAADADAESLPAAATSGNPVIDFFRAVDRGVKSTTATETQPNGGGNPLEE